MPAETYHCTADYLETHDVAPIEEIWRKPNIVSKFGVEYFLTYEGQAELARVTGSQSALETIEEAKEVIATTDWTSIPKKDRGKLSGDSKQHASDRVVEEFAANDFKSMEGVENPSFMTVVKNPEDLLGKLSSLRTLKGYFKSVKRDLEQEPSTSFTQAQAYITNLYIRKTNVILAGEAPSFYNLLDQYRASGNPRLEEYAEELAAWMPVSEYRQLLDKPEQAGRNLERYDKFRNGADVNYTDGYRSVLSPEALELAAALDNTAEQSKEQTSEYYFQDVNHEQLEAIKLDAEQMKEWTQTVLSEYGLLSIDTDEKTEEDSSSSDDKWRVVMSDNVKALSVSNKSRTVKIPRDFERPLNRSVSVLSHELAHVVQHENKRRISPLALVHELGTDRGSVHFEAGGIYWEKQAKQALFGEDRPINPHYLRAVEAKSAGADYLETMRAFFDSSMAQNPDADPVDRAQHAFNRTGRIFRKGGAWAEGAHVTDSQPLQYLEQELVARSLDEEQEKILLAGGFNLQTLQGMNKLGLVDIDKLWIPETKPWDILLPQIAERVYSKEE